MKPPLFLRWSQMCEMCRAAGISVRQVKRLKAEGIIQPVRLLGQPANSRPYYNRIALERTVLQVPSTQ